MMQSRFLRFIDEVSAASSLADLRAIFFVMREEYGFAHVSYLACNLPGRFLVDSSPLYIVTYDRRWCRRYEERNYRALDPVVQYGVRRFRPIDWAVARKVSLEAAAFFDDAERHGVGRHGMTLPIAGTEIGERALLSFSSNRDDRHWRRARVLYARDMFYFGHIIHDQAIALAEKQGLFQPPAALDQIELLYLSALRQGMVPKQIAAEHKITIKTISIHLAKVRKKLGAFTNADAISKAVDMNLIQR